MTLAFKLWPSCLKRLAVSKTKSGPLHSFSLSRLGLASLAVVEIRFDRSSFGPSNFWQCAFPVSSRGFHKFDLYEVTVDSACFEIR